VDILNNLKQNYCKWTIK